MEVKSQFCLLVLKNNFEARVKKKIALVLSLGLN